MANYKFVVRGSNPRIKNPIVLVFRYYVNVKVAGGKTEHKERSLKYVTGYKVLESDWNKEKQTFRNTLSAGDTEDMSKGLEIALKMVESAYYALIKEGYRDNIDNELLRSKLAENSSAKVVVSPYITNYLEEFIRTAPTRIVLKQNGETDVLKKSTIKQYYNTLNVFKEFENFKDSKFRFKDLSLSFHKDFIGYLSVEKSLGKATIGTRVKTLKTLAKCAKNHGLEVNEQVFSREFFKPNNQSIDTYLNESEVQRIFDIDLTHNPKLDRVRDIFIIGVWTSLRISDFSKIKKEDLKDGLIEIEKVQKNGTPIIIPIHPQVEQVIAKYNGGLPRSISDQKFNEYIKELCKLVGINEMTKGEKRVKTEKGNRKVSGTFPKYELIGSHTCRRSFATNNYGKFTNAEIMSVTGHKSEAVFLKYIKITPSEHAQRMRDKWTNKAQENEQNRTHLKKVI